VNRKPGSATRKVAGAGTPTGASERNPEAMKTISKTADKRIVSELNFGAKTAKRVGWESWSFRIVDPLQVEVTNESYGYLADEHRYIVSVGESDGLVVPRECECKADLYNEEYDCKHKVALAAAGGPVVLHAAAAFSPHSTPSAETETATMAEKLKADGGMPETCPNGDPYCDGPESDDLPCFDCFEGEGA